MVTKAFGGRKKGALVGGGFRKCQSIYKKIGGLCIAWTKKSVFKKSRNSCIKSGKDSHAEMTFIDESQNFARKYGGSLLYLSRTRSIHQKTRGETYLKGTG